MTVIVEFITELSLMVLGDCDGRVHFKKSLKVLCDCDSRVYFRISLKVFVTVIVEFILG